jgi:pyruvate dehydrogenase E2 component (dihydrolipoamide acetyltransferase)
MAFEVVIPRLGWNMEEGSLGEWRKQDGEQVSAGEILFTVESDKAVQEVESLESGTLRIPPDSPLPGVVVPVGTLLAYLLEPGEALPYPFDPSTRTQEPVLPDKPVSAGRATPTLTQPAAAVPARTAPGAPAISPRAARTAAGLGLDWTRLSGSGSSGRIVERDVRLAAQSQPVTRAAIPPAEVKASPLARRAAEQLGVDLAQLAEQMPGRRIERADVEAVARSSGTVHTPPGRAAADPMAGDRILAVSSHRRATAERMHASARAAAPVTLTSEVDATELVKLRKQLSEDGARWVPSYTDLIAKIAACALREHPQLNARFEGETILQSAAVHIGIAVDTERGLLAPVLRDVQDKSPVQIARESAGLIERARGGSLRPEELRGATFTLTNLGMYEIDAFTPIINLPECAILGIGRVNPKQVVVDAEAGQVAIRHMLFLSLTFDHRLVDGAPAARCLQRVKQYVEKPYLWLVPGQADSSET